MTVTSSPHGEHAGTVGRHWDTVLVTTETVIDDDPESTAPVGMNDPAPPRPNRATRRAQAQQARRTK